MVTVHPQSEVGSSVSDHLPQNCRHPNILFDYTKQGNLLAGTLGSTFNST
jgi:hypothetical protein